MNNEGGRPAHPGSAIEVLRVALRLGLTSFGGPIAHLGYFRREYVERRAKRSRMSEIMDRELPRYAEALERLAQ